MDMAIKMEKQLKKRGTQQNRFANQISWRSTYPKNEEKVQAKLKKEEETTTNPKSDSKTSTSLDNTVHNHDI